jgi:hypothetical protein
MKKTLDQLTKKEFEALKESGMLWEFYPEAPEFHREIRAKKQPKKMTPFEAFHKNLEKCDRELS